VMSLSMGKITTAQAGEGLPIIQIWKTMQHRGSNKKQQRNVVK
jgi:hypothetical protein